MRNQKFLFAGFLALLAASGFAQDAPSETPAAIDLQPCHIKSVEELAQCATFEVPEDHSNPDGKMISLNIAVLPPSGGQPTNEPLYFLAGGPGQAATELGQIYSRVLRRARRGRTTILIDQRGTGSSEPFNCALPNNPLANGADVARACLGDITQNPEHYKSDDFIKDLEMVRAAFGHEQLSLMGVSYGTRAALLYAKHYEDRVRSMILDSVAPPHVPIFQNEAAHASDILEKVIVDCEQERDCQTAFPTLRADFDALLERLQVTPVSLNIPDADNFTISLNSELFLLGFRGALYAPPTTRLIPFIINEAVNDNYAPWLALTDFGAQEINSGISIGLMMSVQCAEEVSLKAVQQAPVVPSFFPNSYALFWKDACGVWPTGTAPQGFNDPVKVDTPTLLLSGGLDPITPPSMADAAAETLPNSVHLVAPNAGHSVIGYGCTNRLVGDFLEHADPEQMDGECLTLISKPVYTAARFGPKP